MGVRGEEDRVSATKTPKVTPKKHQKGNNQQ